MKKLDDKTYRLRKLADFIGVFVLFMLLLLIWQLYRGPIAMPFLKPYIIRALNHDDAEYQVTVDSVNLELVRSIKPLRIIANKVVYRKNNDELIINAPKTSVSFSVRALLRGIIAPSSVEVIDPTVYIFTSYGVDKDRKEDINRKKIEYYIRSMQDFMEKFNSEDYAYPERFINDIDITGAAVEFHEVDLGRKWVLSDVNYRFDRGLTGLETEINALIKTEEHSASVGLEAIYRPSADKVALRFYFADMIPNDLLGLLDSSERSLTGPYQVDVPLSGKVEALVNLAEVVKNREQPAYSLDTAIEKVHFELEGGSGKIRFAGDEAYNYDIKSLLLKGDLTGGLDRLSIKDAELDLGGQKALIGLEASGFKDYLLKSSPRGLRLSLKAGLPELKVDDLYQYWPRFVAPKAWDWCRESLSGGLFKEANFSFDFAFDSASKKFAFTKLNGHALVEDASLDYLTGMPEITNIYGSADFSQQQILVHLEKGVSGDVILNGGTVDLYDLNRRDNFAKINLTAVGSIADVLKLIDHQPLGYTSQMGLQPDKIKGSAETSLDLAFELKSNLQPDEVKVNVRSALNNVQLPDVAAGKPLEAKKLDLEVTNAGMLVTGVANFEGIPVNLEWNENFQNKEYNSRYRLSFNFDANLKSKLGIDFKAINPPYILGSIPTEAVVTVYPGDKTRIDLQGNLQSAEIDYDFLGFTKKSGTPASIGARLEMAGKLIKSVPKFSLSKPGFNIDGRVDFDAKGNVQKVDITSIKGPKTSARAQIEYMDSKREKYKITVSGDSYNLSPFFAADEKDKLTTHASKAPRPAQAAESDELEKVTDADINIAVNSLWTNETVAIRNFAGTAKLRKGIGIDEMHLVGNFGSSRKPGGPARLKLDYLPRPGKEYLLNIESNDAGSTLKFLRLYDNMRGGTLSVNARRDASKRFVGHAKMRNFNIYNTPVLAKLLTVASFTGIVNLLSGDGIAFSHFDAPFEYQYKTLKIKDARAFGNVMGISGSGSYSARFKEFEIKGVIAPAYGLNTLIGSIPLVGNLLSGKDGTVFGASYTITGPAADPQININPLSALSPNSIKEMFSNLFGGGQ